MSTFHSSHFNSTHSCKAGHLRGIGFRLGLLFLAGFTAMLSPNAQSQAQQARTVRIALISDTHTTRGVNEDQPLYKGHLEQVIADVNRAQVDVVLVAGDLTQSGKPHEQEDFKAQIKAFHAPVLFVPGNHDVGDKPHSGKPGLVAEKRVAQYEQTFGPSFWADTQHGVRIVGINSPLLGSGLPREAEQWAFLDKELARPSTLPTLLLTHYPLYTVAPDEPGGVYWNIEPAPRKRLLALLAQAQAKAVLSGHLHRGLVLHGEGMAYITTQPVSFGLPRGKQSEGWTLVTVAPDGSVQSQPQDIHSAVTAPAR